MTKPVSLRVAAYVRVSTQRQATGELSMPDQMRAVEEWAARGGHKFVARYEEAGSANKEEGRPVFRSMLDDARDPSRPFDAIVVHSYSRFYREGAQQELTLLELRKAGVRVVSITQQLGDEDEPSARLLRRMIGVMDEYQSDETAKHVTRTMLANARDGFWNGSKPPLGYRTVEVEKRGARTKKRLAVDAIEAELVRLIFRLYLHGSGAPDPGGATPPLGVKDVCSWLNWSGYRTRAGAKFGVGPLHLLLTRETYVGRHHFNRTDSRTKKARPREEWIEVAVPAIIDEATFAAVQAKLRQSAPNVTAPRTTNSAVLLGGLATCEACGAGMVATTGTSKSGKIYTYYACGGRHTVGTTACRGVRVPMPKLDSAVMDTLLSDILTPDRIETMLTGLRERRAARDTDVGDRIARLQKESEEAETKLNRLYAAIAAGTLDPTEPTLKAQIEAMTQARDRARDEIDHTRTCSESTAPLRPDQIASFSQLLRSKLNDGDPLMRRRYLREVIDRVEVRKDSARLFGRVDKLEATLAGSGTGNAHGGVQRFVRKWRTRQDSNL